MSTSRIFSLKISCPGCRQAGFVAWEGADSAHEEPVHPRLVFLSRGFHPEPGRARAEGPAIICDVCDEIQDGITGGQVH